MRLLEQIIMEAEFSDPITRRTPVTFEALCAAILRTDDQKVTHPNVRGIAKELGIELHSIKRYIIAAKKEGFMNKDGSVVDKYAKQILGTTSSAPATSPSSATSAANVTPPTQTKPAPKSKPAPKPQNTPSPAPASEPEESEESEEAEAVDNGKAPKAKGSGKLSKSLGAKEKKFIAPKVTNNNLFSKQVFKMLSLMDGQAAKSGVKNSLMLTGDPGVGKCLCGDQEIIVDVDERLFNKLMELKNKR